MRGTEGKIAAIKHARTQEIPFLGICMGMQCLVIEFARNVLKWDEANSTEFDAATPYPVVFEMPEHHPGQMGGTMRLGLRQTVLKDTNSVISEFVYHEFAVKSYCKSFTFVSVVQHSLSHSPP
jgi:CTP synthase